MQIIKKTSVIIYIALLLIFSEKALAGATKGLHIWATAVAPSLFPFIIGCSLLISANIIQQLGKVLNKLSKCMFSLNGNSMVIIILGCISGAPGGAKFTKSAYDEGLISPQQVMSTAVISSAVGPAFILAAANIWLNNASIGYIILLSHWTALIMSGIIFPNKHSLNYKSDYIKINNKKLGDIMNDAVHTMLIIGGYITFFYTLVELAYRCIPFINGNVFAVMHGILEMAGGSAAISATTFNIPLKASLICACVTFNGLSIIFQSWAFLKDTGISLTEYIFKKTIQAVLGFIICYCILL